jgi:hypothetical protein
MGEDSMIAAKSNAIKQIMRFGGERIIFGVTRDGFGVHFWVEGRFSDSARLFGGVEFHWPNRPSWERCDNEGNRMCWLTKQQCWHDGSSLMAEERFIPVFRDCNESGDFRPLWFRLEAALNDMIEDAS